MQARNPGEIVNVYRQIDRVTVELEAVATIVRKADTRPRSRVYEVEPLPGWAKKMGLRSGETVTRYIHDDRDVSF